MTLRAVFRSYQSRTSVERMGASQYKDGRRLEISRGNGQRLDSSTQAGFVDAIDQLNAFGETPILAALDLALAEGADGKSQLVVLLTDGFEFTKARPVKKHLAILIHSNAMPRSAPS